MGDKSSLEKLLLHLGSFPRQARTFLRIQGDNEKELFTVQEFTVQDLKDLILSHIFENPALRNALDEANNALEVTIPALRNALDEANNALKALQEQTPENKMDTVLKRALHYLELHAAHYHSSGADEVVMELRQLIETEHDQIKGETLSFEPPAWEYDYIPFNPSMNYIAFFNKKGADCWELVHCDFEKGIAIFKRSK